MSARFTPSSPRHPSLFVFMAVLGLLLGVPGNVRADSKEKATALLIKAKAGDASAQFELSQLYRTDEMFDIREARVWLAAAAEQNHFGAAMALVETLFPAGVFIGDSEMGEPWLERAAAFGHVKAASALGQLLWNGSRVMRADRKKSHALLCKAALQGDADANFFLGARAIDGVGAKRDVVRGRQLLAKAAALGSIAAQMELQILPENPRSVPSLGRAVEILEGQARKGSARAMLLLGRAYETGAGIDKRYEPGEQADHERRTRAWYAKAIEGKDAEAAARLGMLYVGKRATMEDRQKARALFEQAALAGNALGQMNLALLLLDEKESPGDGARIRELFEAAAATEARAAFELGMMHYEGNRTARNPARAAELFKRAALGGQAKACLNLGVMAVNGEEGPADLTEAVKWWRLAALMWSGEAIDYLARIDARITGGQRESAARKVREWQDARVSESEAQLVMLELKP
jgi:TPR repeat protein